MLLRAVARRCLSRPLNAQKQAAGPRAAAALLAPSSVNSAAAGRCKTGASGLYPSVWPMPPLRPVSPAGRRRYPCGRCVSGPRRAVVSLAALHDLMFVMQGTRLCGGSVRQRGATPQLPAGRAARAMRWRPQP